MSRALKKKVTLKNQNLFYPIIREIYIELLMMMTRQYENHLHDNIQIAL